MASAAVFGATGAIGRDLVAAASKPDSGFRKLTLVTRRPWDGEGAAAQKDDAADSASTTTSSTTTTTTTAASSTEAGASNGAAPGVVVENVVVNPMDVASTRALTERLRGHDVVFCCLGTTRKDAGSAEAFRLVDLHIVLAAAEAAKEADVPHFSVVSAVNAKSSSWFLYPKTKGIMEDGVKALAFPYTTIARPGLLKRPNPRFVEKVGLMCMPSIATGTVAQAMLADALHYRAGKTSEDVHVMYDKDMKA